MTQDPFGNLQEWGKVLEVLDREFQNGNVEDCQQGLIRILRYKGNWRLREEALQNIENIQSPKDVLINEVLKILDDETIYYEARIIACRTLISLLNKNKNCSDQLREDAKSIFKRINSIPQPPFFEKAINTYSQKLK